MSTPPSSFMAVTLMSGDGFAVTGRTSSKPCPAASAGKSDPAPRITARSARTTWAGRSVGAIATSVGAVVSGSRAQPRTRMPVGQLSLTCTPP
jgi:hypothetical protein